MSVSLCFFFKQKTAYEMRISDWSSDVCSSDLPGFGDRDRGVGGAHRHRRDALRLQRAVGAIDDEHGRPAVGCGARAIPIGDLKPGVVILAAEDRRKDDRAGPRPPLVVAADDLAAAEIGRAHVCTPVTNAHLVCRLLPDNNNTSLSHTYPYQ